MQDWNYFIAKCFELTLEISMSKTQNAHKYRDEQIGDILQRLWNQNKQPMINYPIQSILGGLRGFVNIDTQGIWDSYEVVRNVNIVVQGINWKLPVDSYFGDYYRLLAPGQYTVSAILLGCESYNQTVKVEIPNDYRGLIQNFTLQVCDYYQKSIKTQKQFSQQQQKDQSVPLQRNLAKDKNKTQQPSFDYQSVRAQPSFGVNILHLFFATILFGLLVFTIYFTVGKFRRIQVKSEDQNVGQII
eukprot:TRINITY_DN2862_c0_g1_i14.p2 TRINITY_DN2862_c0_g1~~TRINITY_DN2862_c0_g1_i14.p2  ORF type:complete len:278 (-),score=26.87 TRINITY_DN2862_c0_g1_i14:588-1319(-)